MYISLMRLEVLQYRVIMYFIALSWRRTFALGRKRPNVFSAPTSVTDTLPRPVSLRKAFVNLFELVVGVRVRDQAPVVRGPWPIVLAGTSSASVVSYLLAAVGTDVTGQHRALAAALTRYGTPCGASL